MLIKTVTSKLIKNGFKVECTSKNVEGTEIAWRATKEGKKYFLDFSRNGWNSEDVCFIYANTVKGEKEDAIPDDYCAGTFCHTIKRALEVVENN